MRSEEEKTVNKDIYHEIDSIAREAIKAETERLLNSIEEVQTDIIVFDTDKQASDSTGLPPVKAVLKQTAKRKETTTEKTTATESMEATVKEATTDHSTENIATAHEMEERPGWWEKLKQHLMRIVLIPIIIVALWALYKLIKLLK